MSREASLIKPGYRSDIDGLRGIAVLSVVAFHAAPGRFPGGFIGVDIFFVISGYLISTIIISNLEQGCFSFSEFYRRRIRRIFPALLVVLVATLIFGSLVFTPEQYANLGKHAAGGAGFVSNILFLLEISYFDSAAETKPLLHLWSLAIEEQFYIVWPLLLWFMYRPGRNLLWPIALIGIVSFSLSLFTTEGGLAFYLPTSRAWELAAGGVLATISLSTRRGTNDVLSITGFTLLATGFVLIDSASRFPGWLAALPVTGTALVIAAGSGTWLSRHLLSLKPMVWVGLISYPLYLLHWPVLSFMRIVQGQEASQLHRALAILVCIFVAWLIYVFVEKPIRSKTKTRGISVVLLLAMIATGLYGYHVYHASYCQK